LTEFSVPFRRTVIVGEAFSNFTGAAVRLRRGVLGEATGIPFFRSVLWCSLNPPVSILELSSDVLGQEAKISDQTRHQINVF
jgi:hypothetical protein